MIALSESQTGLLTEITPRTAEWYINQTKLSEPNGVPQKFVRPAEVADQINLGLVLVIFFCFSAKV